MVQAAGRGRGRTGGAYRATDQLAAVDMFERADSPDRKRAPVRAGAAAAAAAPAAAAATSASAQPAEAVSSTVPAAADGSTTADTPQAVQQDQAKLEAPTPESQEANGVADEAASSSSEAGDAEGTSKPADAASSAAAAARAVAPAPSLPPPDSLTPEVAAALRSLCAAAVGAEDLSAPNGAPLRLLPRGLTNTGNSCFVNCTLQVLLASSSFCGLLCALARARPALDAAATPMLAALAQFGAHFEPAPAGAGAAHQQKDVESLDAAAAAVSAASAGGGNVKRSGAAVAAAAPAAKQQQAGGGLGAGGRGGLQTEAAVLQLGGVALTPSMFNDVIARFSPRRASWLGVIAGAGPGAGAGAGPSGKLTMAQRLQATGTAGSLEQEQEDAQVGVGARVWCGDAGLPGGSAWAQGFRAWDEGSSKQEGAQVGFLGCGFVRVCGLAGDWPSLSWAVVQEPLRMAAHFGPISFVCTPCPCVPSVVRVRVGTGAIPTGADCMPIHIAPCPGLIMRSQHPFTPLPVMVA